MITIIESSCDLKDIKKNEEKVLKILNKNRNKLDISYLSEYLYLNSSKNKNKLIFFIHKDKNQFLLNIFLKASIEIKGFENYYDLETPYGYGGPLTNSQNKSFLKKSISLFDNWCKNNFILCRLTRFNPLSSIVNNLEIDAKEFIKVKKIAINDVEKNKISLLNYESKTRNMIKKNLNNKIDYKIIDNKSYELNQMNIFKENYLQSMFKKNASNFYFFNNEYFEKISLLIKNKNAFIINAFEKNSAIGGAIFLYNYNFGYYYLSFQNKYPGIMNTIIYKSTQILFDKKVKYLILGGGNLNTDEDNLFKFKLKMSNLVKFFYIETKIFNLDIYNQLCKKLDIKNPKRLLFYKDRILNKDKYL